MWPKNIFGLNFFSGPKNFSDLRYLTDQKKIWNENLFITQYFFSGTILLLRNNQKNLFITNKKVEFETEDQVFDFVVVANNKPKDMNK